ncbi:MAG TPA: hypothetical protein VGB20_05805 [bacterium]
MITTVIGSYPKVAKDTYSTKLIGTIARWQRGEATGEQMESVARDITNAVIAEQEAAGIELVTDGQIRWEDLVTPFAGKLDGIEINGLTRWFNNNVYYRRPVVRGEPTRRGPVLVEALRFAKSCTERPVKAVLPGPYTFATVSEDRHFRSPRRFVRRMAELLNEEAQALAAAGAAMVQFDEPAIGFGKTDMKLAAEGLAIAAQGVKAKTAVATYFGSLNGLFDALMRTPVDVVGIDVVSDPTSLRSLSRARITKELGIGCVDGRNTKLETVTQLHAVFNALRRRVPLDRVYVSPNCGLEFLPHPQALAKLRRLGEAAASYRATRSANR